MKNTPQQWLAGRASPPGMLACGMRRPDRKVICHSLEDICPVNQMERILTQFESVRSIITAGKMAPRWTTWAFEQGQIRYVERPDGWLLGLVIRTDSDAFPKLDPLSTEFLTLEIDG